MILQVIICILAFIAGITLLIGFVALADGEVGAAIACFVICALSVIAAVCMVAPLLDKDGTVAIVGNFMQLLT